MKIIEKGKPHFGCWYGAIKTVNSEEYRTGTARDLWLKTREKRWLYLGIYTDELFIGVAVVNASYVGNAFCYVYDRKKNLLWEKEIIVPLAKDIRVDRAVTPSIVRYQSKGERILIDSNLEHGIRLVDIQLKSEGIELDVRAEIQENISQNLPLQVLTPTADQDFTFTHKNAGLPVLGSIRLGNQRHQLNPEKDSAVVDLTIGYPARETVWNWASATGRLDDGRWIGLNLVSPIFDPQNNENAFWIDGKCIKLGAVVFSYDQNNPDKPWTIETEAKELRLIFQPIGRRSQNIDYKIIKSQFQQPFGQFEGTMKLPSGEVITFNILGVVEEHFARW